MRSLWTLTGGRPMTKTTLAFVDRVTGRGVYHCTDKLGRKWLAEGAWSLFRVEKEQRDA